MAKLMAFSAGKERGAGQQVGAGAVASGGGAVFAIKVSGRKWFKWPVRECKCNFMKLNIYRLSLSKLQLNGALV